MNLENNLEDHQKAGIPAKARRFPSLLSRAVAIRNEQKILALKLYQNAKLGLLQHHINFHFDPSQENDTKRFVFVILSQGLGH